MMATHLHLAPGPGGSSRRDVPIRVAIVDDHALVGRSLRLLLEREADIEVVGDCSDASRAGPLAQDLHPHVLVLGLRLPHASSIETIQAVRAAVPGTAVVALTMQESPLLAQRAIQAGALGFVLKHRADTELVDAVLCAARGEEYVSDRVAAGLDSLDRANGDHGLTPREIEIMRLIALGHTNAEIASKVRVSRRTVETYRARIHRTLGLRTRAELVQFALRRRLIGSD
jgi:two-component system response regulator NreC